MCTLCGYCLLFMLPSIYYNMPLEYNIGDVLNRKLMHPNSSFLVLFPLMGGLSTPTTEYVLLVIL